MTFIDRKYETENPKFSKVQWWTEAGCL